MRPPLRFFYGSIQIRVQAQQNGYADVLNLLHEKNIPFWDFSMEEDGKTATFFLLCHHAKRLASEEAFAKNLQVVGQYGLRPLLWRYRFRFGILFGILTLCLLVFGSGLFLWEIRIEGNESVSKAEIETGLEELGCSIGTFLPKLDCYQVSKAYLLKDGRIAWMSVNLIGNVAHVQVKETQSIPPSVSAPAQNLVALEDGVVMYTTLIAGQSMVKMGQAVRKGELLVSGLVENKSGTYTISSAQGAVYAKVKRTLSAEIPFSGEEFSQKEIVATQKKLQFFKKEWIFSKKGTFFSENSGNLGQKYDTIEEENRLTLFHKIVLPIRYSKVQIVRSVLTAYTLSAEQAQQQATQALARQIEQLADIAKEYAVSEISYVYTDTGVRAYCTAECVVDIAISAPLQLTSP